MPNPLLLLKKNHLGSQFLPLLKQRIIGLAEDFWADGSESLLKLDLKSKSGGKPQQSKKKQSDGREPASATAPPIKPDQKNLHVWHAEPGEISEKMWGEGFVTPGGNIINSMLIKPLGLTKEMSVLDLSAGLGGLMRSTVEDTGAYLTGLEPDAAIAKRGMELSVRAGKSKHAPVTNYDPANIILDRAYDCIIARETFYRLPDQHAFFATIAKHTKPHAQIAFTDYIVDAEHRHAPAIMAWFNNEKLAKPLGLVRIRRSLGKSWVQSARPRGFNGLLQS